MPRQRETPTIRTVHEALNLLTVDQLKPLALEYVNSEPDNRLRLQRCLISHERRLARAWVTSCARQLAYRRSELEAAAKQKDLFGDTTTEAARARRELPELNQRRHELCNLTRVIKTRGELPFFSFAVHFPESAERGFDVVVCNPPWVRTHSWSRSLSAVVRRRFEIGRCGQQIDLALLFLERALDLLHDGGVLGIILPAKFIRSLAGTAARRMLLTRSEIVSVEDHSLDQKSIFDADSFAALVVARKCAAPANSRIATTVVRRNAPPLSFELRQNDLSDAPWLLVPDALRAALQRMDQNGVALDLLIRRGVVTGKNDALILSSVTPRLGNLVSIRAQGFERAANPSEYEAVIEENAVRKLVRGCDVHAWNAAQSHYLICQTTEHRALAYLSRQDCAAPQVAPVCSSHVVAWHDLASNVNAVVIPSRIVALNTVYFVATDEATSHLLCAYFNSLPFRTYARAIAERAKDAHFRFFAWTMARVPLPQNWRSFACADLQEISRVAHARGSIEEAEQQHLDDVVARAYRLSRSDCEAIRNYDRWLRGV